MTFQLDSTLMIVAAVATGIVVMLGVARLSRFYVRFLEAKKDIEANLLTLNGQIKMIQVSMTELVSEQRRQSRLMLEQLNLKRAEMTGDYEVIEETILPDAPAAPVQDEAASKPPKAPKSLFNLGAAFKKNSSDQQ